MATISSNTGIANLAISHLGIGKEIENLDSDKSQEANAIRRYYDTALEMALQDYPWPFARRFQTLSLVSENPTTEWVYAYRYPSDCLDLRRLLSGIRNDTRQSRVEYWIVSDSGGKLIYTDLKNAIAEYTYKVESPEYYPSDFILSFSYQLAMLAASRLTAGDPFNLIEKVSKLYEMHMSRARRRNQNEEQRAELPNSEFIRSREGYGIFDLDEDKDYF